MPELVRQISELAHRLVLCGRVNGAFDDPLGGLLVTPTFDLLLSKTFKTGVAAKLVEQRLQHSLAPGVPGAWLQEPVSIPMTPEDPACVWLVSPV